MARGPTMKSLQERLDSIMRELDRAMREVEKIKAQEALIRDMIREANGESSVKSRAPRSNVKQAVLDLLEKVGSAGLNASMAVDMAASEGLALERGTVSSLLSRMKNEGVVIYENGLYRLSTYRQGNQNITPLRVQPTSGGFS